MADGEKITGFLLDLNKYLTKELANENLSARAEQSRLRYVAHLSDVLSSTGGLHTGSGNGSRQKEHVHEIKDLAEKLPKGREQTAAAISSEPGLSSSSTTTYIYENTLAPTSGHDPTPSIDNHRSTTSAGQPVLKSNNKSKTVNEVAKCETDLEDVVQHAYDVIESPDLYSQQLKSSDYYEQTGSPLPTKRKLQTINGKTGDTGDTGETGDSDTTEYESYDDDVTDGSRYDVVTWSANAVTLTGASFYGTLLRKIGQGDGGSTSMVKRLCVIRGPLLMTFDPDNIVGSQKMKHLEDYALDEWCVERGQQQQDAMYEIRLMKQNREPVVFCTDKVEDANRWIQELKAAISTHSYVVLQSSNNVENESSTCSPRVLTEWSTDSSVNGRSPNVRVTSPVKPSTPASNPNAAKRGPDISHLNVHLNPGKKSSKIKLFLQSLTKKPGKRQNTESTLAGCVEVCSNLSALCQSFSQRYCVVCFGMLTCFTDLSDSTAAFSLSLSGTTLSVIEGGMMIKLTKNSDHVTFKISDVAEYHSWYSAFEREGAARSAASGCISNSNQVSSTEMYEEITPLQSHQINQTLLYEEVGAVCERIPSTSLSPQCTPVSAAGPTSPPRSTHRSPPPIPTSAPPVSPFSSDSVTLLDDDGKKRNAVEDYMTPNELRGHASLSRTLSPRSRDAIYMLESPPDGVENTYMNVEERKKTHMKRSQSFDKEHAYIDMSQCSATQLSESRSRSNRQAKTAVHFTKTSLGCTAVASDSTVACAIYANQLVQDGGTRTNVAPPASDYESCSNEYILQCVDNLKPSPASATSLFDSVAHDNQVSHYDYVKPTIVGRNSSRPVSDFSGTEQSQPQSVIVTTSVADCVGGCQAEDQPETVVSVPQSKPTGSKALPSVITSMTTSLITRSDSKHYVAMATTTTGDVDLPVLHPTSSIVAKTTKTAFVSSLSSSPKLPSTRKTVSTVTMTTEPVPITAQEPAKMNRGLLSDVIVVNSNGQSNRLNAAKDGEIERLSDPKADELPKGLVQQRMKMFQSKK